MSPFSRFSQYFTEVARTGSLRKAAEVLHVSASAINRQILQAEQTLETPLFERLTTGLKLTSAGEILFDDIRRWRKEFSRTRERFDEIQGLRRGHVTISMIAALSEGMVAELIAEVGKEHPYLTFDIRIEDSRNISEQVSSAEVDFGCCSTRSNTPGWRCAPLRNCRLASRCRSGTSCRGRCRYHSVISRLTGRLFRRNR